MAKKGSGWVTFSWVIFMLAGLVNLLYGAIALGRKEYFPSESVIYDVIQSHGWIWLIIGLLQLLVSYAIARRSQIGLFGGVVLAVIGATIWFFYMLFLPSSGFALVLLYALVIFGLASNAEEFAVD